MSTHLSLSRKNSMSLLWSVPTWFLTCFVWNSLARFKEFFMLLAVKQKGTRWYSFWMRVSEKCFLFQCTGVTANPERSSSPIIEKILNNISGYIIIVIASHHRTHTLFFVVYSFDLDRPCSVWCSSLGRILQCSLSHIQLVRCQKKSNNGTFYYLNQYTCVWCCNKFL